MIQKILVATDTSDASALVFDQALMLATLTGAHLGIIHVTDPDDSNAPPFPGYLENLKPYLDEGNPEPCCYVGAFGEDDSALFGRSVKKAKDAGVSHECVHCFGNPETAISDFAAVWKADLIVVGHRGLSGLSEFLLGSVSNYMLHNAPCSVYIVHPSNSESNHQSRERSTTTSL
jgi:nucleotide-binding universal stress UspA family protein